MKEIYAKRLKFMNSFCQEKKEGYSLRFGLNYSSSLPVR
jgi:hypothetical protein